MKIVLLKKPDLSRELISTDDLHALEQDYLNEDGSAIVCANCKPALVHVAVPSPEPKPVPKPVKAAPVAVKKVVTKPVKKTLKKKK